MKGFNRIWRLLPSSPRNLVGDPLLSLLFLNNDRFPTTTLGNDNNRNGITNSRNTASRTLAGRQTLRNDGLTTSVRTVHTCPTSAGFTLIELLVVVLIIGILASVAMPQYDKAVKKARLTKVIPLVKTLANAEEVFYMSNGHYTNNVSELDVDMPAGGTLVGESTDDGYVRFPDGTVIDLLDGDWHYPGSRALVAAYLKDNLRYFQYLEHSSRPNMRICDGNEAVCKSMGGTLIAGTNQYQLP